MKTNFLKTGYALLFALAVTAKLIGASLALTAKLIDQPAVAEPEIYIQCVNGHCG